VVIDGVWYCSGVTVIRWHVVSFVVVGCTVVFGLFQLVEHWLNNRL
jgi:hypothetical protein